MPKQVLKIDQFHGGINSNADPRDIGKGQMVSLKNVAVNKFGKIQMMGSGINHPVLNINAGYTDLGCITVFPDGGGYNLFTFSHDRTGGHLSTAVEDQDELGDDYVCLATGNSGNVAIYSRRADAWGLPIAGKFTSTTGSKRWQSIFNVVDGDLRIGDGQHTTGNVPYWYGYLERTHFSSSGHAAGKVWSQWQNTRNNLLIVGSTNYGKLNEGATDDDAYGAFDGPDLDWLSYAYPIGLEVAYNKNPDGGWTDHVLYYYSFIYDDDSESHLQRFDAIDDLADGDSHYKKIRLTVLPAYFHDKNSRVTGCKIYWKKATSTTDTTGETYLLLVADWHPTKSVRKAEDRDNWQPWSHMDPDPDQSGYSESVRVQTRHTGLDFEQPPRLTTYHNETGIRDGDQESNKTHAKYKTAVVTNRRMYVGNVQSMLALDGGNVNEVHGDRVLKSLPNKFDTFPEDRHLDVSVQDGDEIVKLESFADRLLQFKKKKLHIVNIAEDVEFLEATYDFKGVSRPSAACKTDFGIAWANLHGVYFYDGQKVNNLLEKEGFKLIDDDTWKAFALNSGDGQQGASEVDNCNVSIGYLPVDRAIIVLNNTQWGSGSRDVYYFDLITQSWSFGEEKIPITTGAERLSNFSNDWNGDLILAKDAGDAAGDTKVHFYKWDNTPSGGNIEIITKDFDFGEPGVRKKVYRVHITYKGGSGFPDVTYGVNGDSTPNTAATAVTDFTSSSDWNRAEFKFDSDTNSCYSFQLKISGSAPHDFEINDMSLIFRLKNVR